MRNAALVIGATGRVSNASPHYRTNAISVFFCKFVRCRNERRLI